jgi:hypothetical protein
MPPERCKHTKHNRAERNTPHLEVMTHCINCLIHIGIYPHCHIRKKLSTANIQKITYIEKHTKL